MPEYLGMDEFRLGEPALVCRWRLANRKLPMENRHLRALAGRTVNGKRVDQGLVAWVGQHIEWSLESGAAAYPDGVLMLIIDTDGQAAMTVGPFEPLRETSLSCLVERSRQAHKEAEVTGVSPETLWIVRDNVLVWDDEPATVMSGSASLIEGLARTMGLALRRAGDLCDGIAGGMRDFDEAFLVSDEYGVVPAIDYSGEMARRFAGGYERLLLKDRKR